jgi:16S rRNA (guanine527-N7)-methyltransferase
MQKTEVVRELLESGIKELELVITPEQIDKMLAYLLLLDKWNKVYSLTSIIDIHKIVTHHLLDGLTIIKSLDSYNNIIDVGSGMGVPGILIAIFYPEKSITVIDCVQKKTAFLRQVGIELELDNLTIVNSLVEAYKPDIKFDVAVSRAFANSLLFISLVKHLFTTKTVIITMKAQSISVELDAIEKTSLYNYEVITVKIPGVLDQRYLLKIDEK